MSPAHNVVSLSKRSRKASFDDFHFSIVLGKSNAFEKNPGDDFEFQKKRDLSMGG